MADRWKSRMILLQKPPVASVNLFEAPSGVKTHVDLSVVI